MDITTGGIWYIILPIYFDCENSLFDLQMDFRTNDTAECTDPRLEINCTDPGSVQNCSDICMQNNGTFPPECQDELFDICVRDLSYTA